MLQIPNSFKFGKLVSCKNFPGNIYFQAKLGNCFIHSFSDPDHLTLGLREPNILWPFIHYTYLGQELVLFPDIIMLNFFQFSFMSVYLGVCLFKRICASLLNVSVNIHVCLYRIYRSIAISVYVFA